MKHIKTFTIALVLALVINVFFVSSPAANAGVATFKTALMSAVQSNFTAA